MLACSLAACGDNSASKDSSKQEETKEKTEKKKTKKKDQKKKKENKEEGKEKAGEQSLAKRLCGKYSREADAEYCDLESVEIISIGDNLYGFGGESNADDGSDPEMFSFWAIEWFPENEEDLKSTTADSVELSRLTFSVMSMAGKYQGAPVQGTITLTDDGVILDGFGEGKCEYKKDDSIEDAFPYLDDGTSSENSEKLQGVWKLKGADDPVWWIFDGSSCYVYEKIPGKEVSLYAGNYEADGTGLHMQLSCLGNGGMPYECELEIEIDGDKIRVSDNGYCDLDYFEQGAEFVRSDESEIPVRAAYSEFSASTDTDTDAEDLFEADPMQRPFYGVFTSTTTDRDAAILAAGKLLDQGYDGTVTYSPEWDNLNSKPFFCVLAGRYDTQEDADEALADVKADGYKDAYVKFSGQCTGTRMTFTNTGMMQVKPVSGAVILSGMELAPTYDWYSGDGEDWGTDAVLIVDANTVFDPDCETEFFGYYEEGDSVYDWYLRNLRLAEEDPDNYGMYGMPLSGVFEINTFGNRVDRFYGSYWWD